jgi:hypothetical protein
MRKNHKLVAAAALVAAVAGGGSAFTNALDVTADASDVLGSGSVTVSGGIVKSVKYATSFATNPAGNVTGVTVIFDGRYDTTTEVSVEIDTVVFTCPAISVANHVDFAGTAVLKDATEVTCTAAPGVPNVDVAATSIAIASQTAPLGEEV